MASPLPATDPTAVLGRRVLATLIDAALILVPAILLLSASFEYLEVDALDRDPQAFCDDFINQQNGFCLNFADVDDRVYFTDGVGSGSGAVYWGGTFLLLVVVQGLTGRTLGKLLTGIRTVGEDGRPPGLLKAFLRWLMWVVDAFPYVIPLLGPIVAGTTQGHRRVGDMVAKTFVVRASAAGAPIVVPGLTAPAPSTTYAGSGAWGGQPAPWAPTGTLNDPAGNDPAVNDPAASGWAAPGAPTTTPGADGPQWDAARNTYIQWDPAQRRWLQWDESERTWSVIPGQ